ncbi:uncharacterized protein VP01_336g4 [Puccinia sorghi]|uniref:DDE Tnp4 domain-containing protein n=1 Tax=Puccinia sorghi TaxID=27349 RepID=A0A0L6UWY4_9BASI|nr:uncharacterized protein VP01_336g4 [Puccinia sorghi]
MARTVELMLQKNETFFPKMGESSLVSFDSTVSSYDDLLHQDTYESTPLCLSTLKPVEWQLLVALVHLGLNGNGGSPHIPAQVFDISEGSAENYTNRCLSALIDLESKYFKSPSRQERAVCCSENNSSSVYTNCVGLVDGTIISLSFAPAHHKDDYTTATAKR